MSVPRAAYVREAFLPSFFSSVHDRSPGLFLLRWHSGLGRPPKRAHFSLSKADKADVRTLPSSILRTCPPPGLRKHALPNFRLSRLCFGVPPKIEIPPSSMVLHTLESCNVLTSYSFPEYHFPPFVCFFRALVDCGLFPFWGLVVFFETPISVRAWNFCFLDMHVFFSLSAAVSHLISLAQRHRTL